MRDLSSYFLRDIGGKILSIFKRNFSLNFFGLEVLSFLFPLSKTKGH